MVIDASAVTDAYWDSDLGVPGCGAFTQCLISGHWQLTSSLPARIPEPSAAVILMAGMAAFGLLRRAGKGG
jgi:hypothetical protein